MKLTVKKVSIAIVLILLSYLYFNSLDGISGIIGGILTDEDTYYAEGYSDRRFKTIKIGMNKSEVIKIMGEPIDKDLEYDRKRLPTQYYYHISFTHNQVNKHDGIQEDLVGKSLNDVVRLLGQPIGETWWYSLPLYTENYRRRVVQFRNDVVVGIEHEFYFD